MIVETQGRVKEAEEQYKKVLAINPEAAVAANNLAWIYVASGRADEEAFRLAKAAQRRLPDEPNVNDTLGWIYYLRQDYREAIRCLEASVQKAPKPLTFYHLGMAYVRTGDTDKARDALTRSLSFKTEFDGIAEARKALAELPR